MTDSETLLKSKKLRKTALRLRVLDLFLGMPHSAVQTSRLEEELGEVDRITLYRTLKTFEKEAIIHRVMDGTQLTKYALCHDTCTTHNVEEDHAHFLCESCSETFCVGSFDMKSITLPATYKVTKVQLALSGICPNCN